MRKGSILIKGGTIVNRGKQFTGDIFIKDGFIDAIGTSLDRHADREINAEGCLVLPGIIDDQVHFREPGLTHKATIKTESRAAVAGGTTTFMEMPNTKPAALTQELLQAKYDKAAQVSPANYSFYMGASNDNREQALRTDPKTVCGLKIFMGSSTGNMLVDDRQVLDALFANCPLLIVCVHHLTFNADDYLRLGNKIKCNPAIKAEHHRKTLLPALLDDRFDVIATDHAPHTADEKARSDYFKAPGGLPLVQHSLDMMMRMVQNGDITLERVIEKMCHAPAVCFEVDRRGYLDEGMFADIIIYDPKETWTVAQDNIFYKVGWSPLEGETFNGRVRQTIVSGHLAYDRGLFFEEIKGMRLGFKR